MAGIGGRVQGIVETARGSKNVVIDGCGVKCALKTLEAAAVPVHTHVILTEWGIRKMGDVSPDHEAIQQVKQRLIKMMG